MLRRKVRSHPYLSSDARDVIMTSLNSCSVFLGGKDAKKDAGQAPLPETPSFPEAWDSSVASIRGVITELWKLPDPGTEPAGTVQGSEPVAGPFSDAAEALGRRVDVALELMRSPPDGGFSVAFV